MALSDAEALVYAKSDEVVSETVSELVSKLDPEYRGFTGRLSLGIILLIAGIALVVFAYYIINLPILLYSGIGLVVVGAGIAAYAFKLNIRVEVADLKLYPILFAGFEHGEFFAIDPYGNGDEVSLPYYNLEDLSEAENTLGDLQGLVEQAFRGELGAGLSTVNIDGKTLIIPKPLKLLYETRGELIEKIKGMGVEYRKYNMIMPEENDVPNEIKIPVEKSGFTEDMAMKKIDLETVEKLFHELVGINRNWEEVVDKLKDIREKYEPLHGQIHSHYQWLRDNAVWVINTLIREQMKYYEVICPRCLLSRNYFSDPGYPVMGLVEVKEEEEAKTIYQCGACGLTIEADEHHRPVNGLKVPVIDEYFNHYWLGVFNNNRGYIEKLIGDTVESKRRLIEDLRGRLRGETDRLMKLLEEFMGRVDRKLLDVKLYTDVLEKIGIEGAGGIYKAVYENAEFMGKTLRESPDQIAESLLDLLTIRIDPSLFNQTYLKRRRQAAELLALEDLASLIESERHILEYEKLKSLFSPLYVEQKGGEEVKEEGEVGEQ